MAFPWHQGATAVGPYRRVLHGEGHADPHSQFLERRAHDEKINASKKYNAGRHLLNLQCAWEDHAVQKVATARSARESAAAKLASAERKAARSDRLSRLYAADSAAWMQESLIQRTPRPPSLENLRAQANAIETAREAERQATAREQLDRAGLDRQDSARPFAAQARLEEVVASWRTDQEAKAASMAAQQQQAEVFDAQWTARGAGLPQGPAPDEESAQREAAARAAADLKQAWAGNAAGRALAAAQEDADHQAFVRKWVGENEDNMYIWRDQDALPSASEEDANSPEEAPPVAVKMALDLDFKAACGDAESVAAFTATFAADTAALLGVDPSCIRVTDLTAGSIVVHFEICHGGGNGLGGVSPSSHVAQLAAVVATGSVAIAGGSVEAFEEVALSPQALVKHHQRMVRTRAERKLQAINVELAAQRQATQTAARAAEQQQDRALAEANAAAVANAKRFEAEQAAVERQERWELEQQRRADKEMKQRAESEAQESEAAAFARGESAEMLLWRRAENDLARRRAASESLQAAVATSRQDQLTRRDRERTAEAEARRADALAVQQQAAEFEAMAAQQHTSRRAEEQAARAAVWEQMKAQEERRRAEAEQAKQQALAEEAREAMAAQQAAQRMPSTQRTPRELRPRGVARVEAWQNAQPTGQKPAGWVPPSARSSGLGGLLAPGGALGGAVTTSGSSSRGVPGERHAAATGGAATMAAEWSFEVDRWAHASLPPHAAATLVDLKNKFMAAETPQDAENAEQDLRRACGAFEAPYGHNALRVLEPAFLDKGRFCLRLRAFNHQHDNHRHRQPTVPPPNVVQPLDLKDLARCAPFGKPSGGGAWTPGAPPSSRSTLQLW